jgi:SagB-type dehydrogenase family enzyme
VLIPPSALSGERWLAENLLVPSRIRIPAAGAMLLVAASAPTQRGRLVREVAKRTSLPSHRLAGVLRELERAGLIDECGAVAQEDRLAWLNRLRRTWKRVNWQDAAEYHAYTFDYPPLDYLADGWDRDTERMLAYVAEAPDDNRYKTYDNALKSVRLPEPSEHLFPTSLADAFDVLRPEPVTRDALFAILTIAFAQTGEVKHGRWPRAPIVRRTSPSGGSRQPTEAYLLALAVPGVEPGWYHVAMHPPALELISDDVPPVAELNVLFPLSFRRVPLAVACIVILTSVFERNMYRYREPRTFRTVHMDAGHLAATVQLTAAARNIRTHVCYPENDEAIERRLGVHGLQEGFMLAIALGVP